MPLLSCRVCGKIFASPGGRICSSCGSRLDALWPRVREYLRDNPKAGLDIKAISRALNQDVRYIQALVDMGYLGRKAGNPISEEAQRRHRLARELERSLKQAHKNSEETPDRPKNKELEAPLKKRTRHTRFQ